MRYCCTSCCCCCKDKECFIKENGKNKEENIKKLNEDEEKIKENLKDFRKNFIKENSNEEKNEYICIDVKIIYLLFLSLFHFIALTEVNGVIYSLFEEIKKTLYCYFADKYDTDTKTFEKIFLYSTLNDSSLININNIAYLFSQLFIIKFGPIMTYILSVIIIIAVTTLMLIFDFLTEKEITDDICYPWYKMLALICSYIFIYFFSGIISFYPIDILRRIGDHNIFNNLLIYLSLALAVFTKNLYHGYLGLHLGITILVMSGGFGIFLLFYLTILFHCQKKIYRKIDSINNAMNESYSASYYCGYLIINNDFIKLIVKIEDIFSYLCSIICNLKILLLFIIVSCSRAQKFKFKTDYKLHYKNCIELLSLNFLISYAIYLVIALLKLSKYLIQIKKEVYIIFFVSFENFIIIVITCITYIYHIEILIYFSIALSGSINFLVYEYYSLKKEDYVPLIGVITISQWILRLFELCVQSFDNNNWYLLQILFSMVGICCTTIYIIMTCQKKKYNQMILNNLNFEEKILD